MRFFCYNNRNSQTAKKIQDLFHQRKLFKQYLAITKNIPDTTDGIIDIPLLRREINGNVKVSLIFHICIFVLLCFQITIYFKKTYLSPKYDETTSLILPKPKKENDQRRNAITSYRVLDTNNKAALIELQPKTGFQHQLRAHLAFGLGCPVLGDHKYSHQIKNAPQVYY